MLRRRFRRGAVEVRRHKLAMDLRRFETTHPSRLQGPSRVEVFTDVSGHIGLIFKGQAAREEFLFHCLVLQNGTDILSRNVGIQLPIYAANIPEERTPLRSNDRTYAHTYYTFH